MEIHVVIAQELGVKPHQVEAAITLLDEGNTVPFIARYRKEVTGELKDEQLREIEERVKYLRNLLQRKEEVTKSIEEQGKLTEELSDAIAKAMKLQELEDLYLPFRPKKRTRASMARDRGLEPLAQALFTTATEEELRRMGAEYLNEEVPTVEDALQGAMDIVAEEASERADIRQYLRKAMWETGHMKTELVGEEEVNQGFIQYNEEYKEPIRQVPSHRVLAMNRGESLGALKVSFVVPDEIFIQYMVDTVQGTARVEHSYIAEAIADGYKRLLYPSLERETRNAMTEQAEEQAIKVFGTNLRNLLLQAPLSGHVIMGLDPGYRTGCKMAIIDREGNVLDYGAYYLTMSDKQAERAKQELAKKIRQYGVTLISIGNGTASYETEQFTSAMIAEEGLDCHYIITNEAGASVYSASKLAIEELPDLDVSIRGAVSIARRVQDPLAESVKIDPKSIGVGQYQHDVNQKQLGATLDQVVETVVNHVGVELNTASPAILKHVSGISSTVANNIIAYRKEHGAFTSRKQLLKVARLGPAAFTQCAGFLRIGKGENPLDATPVHPESYEIAQGVLTQLGMSLEDLRDKATLETAKAKLQAVNVEELAKQLDAGVPTVRDIVEALQKPGRDPREDLPAPMTRKQIMSLEDIQVGTVVKGTVHNVVDFGAFVDFGVKINGLLHKSEFCAYHEHPSDVLAVGDIIEVEIISVDAKRNRIGLSMKREKPKDPNRQGHRRNGDGNPRRDTPRKDGQQPKDERQQGRNSKNVKDVRSGSGNPKRDRNKNNRGKGQEKEQDLGALLQQWADRGGRKR